MVQLSHPYMTTGKTIALAIWTSVSKVMPLLFNMLSRFVIAFLPRTKQNYISSIIHLVHSPPSVLPHRSLEKQKEKKIQKKKKKKKAKRLHFLNYPLGSFFTFSSFLSFCWKTKENKNLHTLCSIHEPPIQRERPWPLCFLFQSQILLPENKTI